MMKRRFGDAELDHHRPRHERAAGDHLDADLSGQGRQAVLLCRPGFRCRRRPAHVFADDLPDWHDSALAAIGIVLPNVWIPDAEQQPIHNNRRGKNQRVCFQSCPLCAMDMRWTAPNRSFSLPGRFRRSHGIAFHPWGYVSSMEIRFHP